MTSSFSTNWFKIQKTTLWLTAVSRVFNIIEDCQWKWLFYFSLALLFLCIKHPWPLNPKTLTASDFARVKSITGLLDRLETDSVRREKKHHCLQYIQLRQKLPSKPVYESQHVLQAIDIALQAINFSHYNNYHQLPPASQADWTLSR